MAFSWPLLRGFDNWGIQDWDQHLFYRDVPRHTLLGYRQFPLWNPFYCGGTVMLANPQSAFLSPTYLLVLLFGAVHGVKLEIVVHLVIGLVGTYYLARALGVGRLAAWLSASVFMLNSAYALDLAYGMTWYLTVAWVPWAVLALRRSVDDVRAVWWCAVALTLIFLGGGAYVLPFTALFMALHTTLDVSQGDWRRRASRVALVGILTVLLSAVKLLPAVEYVHSHPRPMDDYSGYSLTALAHALVDRDARRSPALAQNLPGLWNGASYGLDENLMYVGYLPLLLSLAGLVSGGRRHWPLAVCGALFLWLSLGDRAPVSLWHAVHRLPVFDSMRVAQRCRIITILCLAIFAGLGLEAVRSSVQFRFGARIARTLVIGIVATVVADLFAVNRPFLALAFPIPPLHRGVESEFFQIGHLPPYDATGFLTEDAAMSRDRIPLCPYPPDTETTPLSAMYPAFRSNTGVVDCYESATVFSRAAPMDGDRYRGEFFLVGTAGRISLDAWSPNRIRLAVAVPSEGFAVVNQNYDRGWRVTDGRRTVPLDCRGERCARRKPGMIAVRVGPGDRVVELVYRPTSFVLGALVSMLTVMAGFARWLASRLIGRRCPGAT